MGFLTLGLAIAFVALIPIYTALLARIPPIIMNEVARSIKITTTAIIIDMILIQFK